MSTQEIDERATAAVSFHRVGSVAELRGGQSASASVEGKQIAVFAVDDEYIATSGVCPHAGGPLHDGEVEGRILTCPWHGFTFDLDSGACVDDPCLNLERFEVRIEGDDILVRL